MLQKSNCAPQYQPVLLALPSHATGAENCLPLFFVSSVFGMEVTTCEKNSVIKAFFGSEKGKKELMAWSKKNNYVRDLLCQCLILIPPVFSRLKAPSLAYWSALRQTTLQIKQHRHERAGRSHPQLCSNIFGRLMLFKNAMLGRNEQCSKQLKAFLTPYCFIGPLTVARSNPWSWYIYIYIIYNWVVINPKISKNYLQSRHHSRWRVEAWM